MRLSAGWLVLGLTLLATALADPASSGLAVRVSRPIETPLGQLQRVQFPPVVLLSEARHDGAAVTARPAAEVASGPHSRLLLCQFEATPAVGSTPLAWDQLWLEVGQQRIAPVGLGSGAQAAAVDIRLIDPNTPRLLALAANLLPTPAAIDAIMFLVPSGAAHGVLTWGSARAVIPLAVDAPPAPDGPLPGALLPALPETAYEPWLPPLATLTQAVARQTESWVRARFTLLQAAAWADELTASPVTASSDPAAAFTLGRVHGAATIACGLLRRAAGPPTRYRSDLAGHPDRLAVLCQRLGVTSVTTAWNSVAGALEVIDQVLGATVAEAGGEAARRVATCAEQAAAELEATAPLAAMHFRLGYHGYLLEEAALFRNADAFHEALLGWSGAVSVLARTGPSRPTPPPGFTATLAGVSITGRMDDGSAFDLVPAELDELTEWYRQRMTGQFYAGRQPRTWRFHNTAGTERLRLTVETITPTGPVVWRAEPPGSEQVTRQQLTHASFRTEVNREIGNAARVDVGRWTGRLTGEGWQSVFSYQPPPADGQ